MNDEQLRKIGDTLEQILAELRKMNEREDEREAKASAIQDRFSGL